ncbi:hypothetical protein NDU88_004846 [Pleurodeles waltl]|uniref:Uncharacterized protein n=1 Tax=Pleurodeles waltl TaxID=8319 RepID=A0AAV7LMP7_PLEWA|nr:hypothetical protein NDU88_004846 [Pleurodeles waltl]
MVVDAVGWLDDEPMTLAMAIAVQRERTTGARLALAMEANPLRSTFPRISSLCRSLPLPVEVIAFKSAFPEHEAETGAGMASEPWYARGLIRAGVWRRRHLICEIEGHFVGNGQRYRALTVVLVALREERHDDQIGMTIGLIMAERCP